MAAAADRTTSSEFWSRFARLPPEARTVLRLKALIGTMTSKTAFFVAMTKSGTRAPDGTVWSVKTLNPLLDDLQRQGLLDENLACLPGQLHALAAEAADSPESAALIEAARNALPASDRRYYASYDLHADENARRSLRLTIYANDEAEYRRQITVYANSYNPARGPHWLERMFLHTPVGLDWLVRRAIDIQYGIFATKLEGLLTSGTPAPDIAELLAHYRANQNDPALVGFKEALLSYDLLAGNLADARLTVAELEVDHDFVRPTFLGTLEFLAGRNAEAIELYREALKSYRKSVGKRKVFLQGSNGVFFLMALLRTGDAALHAEIQAGLDAINHLDTPYGSAFLAMQALLWLVQGLDAKARNQLEQLRAAMPDEPLSAACFTLAEYVVDPDLARAHAGDTAARFDRLRECLPLIARIHAGVLAAVDPAPARYEAFLGESCAGEPVIDFTGIVQVAQPWERAFDSLAHALRGTTARPAAAAATTKARRLVWFVNPEQRTVEILEQSAKGRDGWTPGRAVAMKRLYEQDPRLDYLTDHDRRVLRTIRKEVQGWHNDENFAFDLYRTLLALVGHPTVFDARRREQPLELVAYPVELIVSEQRNGYKFSLSHRAAHPTAFLEAETPTRYRVIDVSERVVALQEILGPKGLTVPRSARERVVALVQEKHPTLPIRAEVADIDLPAIAGATTPVVQLAPLGAGAGAGAGLLDAGLKVSLVVRPFGTEGPCYLAGQGGQSVLAVIQGQRLRANRDLDGERAATAALVAACPTLGRLGDGGHEWSIADTESALEFLLELQAFPDPVTVEWPQGRKMRVSAPVSAGQAKIGLSHSRNWFRLDGSVSVDAELVIDMKDLLERLERAQGRFVPLDDGRFLTLTRQFQKQLERLRAVSEPERDGRRLPALGTVAVQDLIEEAGTLKADRHWKEFAARLRAAGEHTPVVPSTLQAELRDYQAEGFAWLSRLAHWGAGACLADDMGLGKTVQAIALLLEQAPQGPCLVLAPTSVCHNWEAELARFAPTLTVRRLGAVAERAEVIAGLGAMDVLVTSYGLLHQEADRLAAVAWRVVVFDEAQAIKNAETRRAQASQRLQAAFRVALTGTPVENYLDELWSLFNVINPGLLGSKESFQRRFSTPVERDRDAGARQTLRALIRPFILRRTKSQVLTELPPRTEMTLEIELPEEERAFYEALRQKALENLEALSEDPAAGGQRKIHILAEITRLRRACCHPGLVDAQSPLAGAKLEAFLELVTDLTRNHHKALVFSQFVGQLERVRAALDARGIRYQYLDGSTPAKDRERRVAAFQAGDGALFLISLRAGGVGLNLTAADYVIHLDPWWNPAVEDQASDRAHRIGQQRPVTVYRLIVRDSIEEKMVRLHKDKRDLAAGLLEGTETSARLSEEQLLDLIRV